MGVYVLDAGVGFFRIGLQIEQLRGQPAIAEEQDTPAAGHAARAGQMRRRGGDAEHAVAAPSEFVDDPPALLDRRARFIGGGLHHAVR
ncbi:hypothetical protein [Lysobacter sp. CA199]|uniref:hypothetical protein n=1 Tax=Lysobacter sp. CA199 TaxID=3455608 RepID=UPI003F8D38C1